MDDHHLARAQQMLRDDERADGVGGAPAGVADHVGVALLEPQEPRGVQPGIHAGDHRKPALRRARQMSLGEPARVGRIGGQELLGSLHLASR
jgi:hypothetical protein